MCGWVHYNSHELQHKTKISAITDETRYKTDQSVCLWLFYDGATSFKW
jgi:hypothetical protein